MAYFTISKSRVIEQFQTLKNCCDIVSYSSKTNPLVSTVLEEGTDSLFSIHMQNELLNIKDHSRVLFLAQGWDEEQIDRLIQNGIAKFVLDNVTDIDTLISYLGNNRVDVTVLLRLKVKEHSVRTERYYVFGMDMDVTIEQIKRLKQILSIKEVGIHFHRKTQNTNEWNYMDELEHITQACQIDILNAGGGFPSEYANTNVNVIGSVLDQIKQLHEWCKKKNITFMLEPGRFIAAPAGKLHTTVVSVHDKTIIVDASVYNSDMDAILVPVKLKVQGEKNEGIAYTIKGVTPCSMDIYRYRVFLDLVKKGDLIVFENAGAYNFSSDFCNLEKIETRFIE